MKKYTDISKSLKPKLVTESPKYDRDSFVRGNLFSVGDVVEHSGRKAEIINVGSNYVTLIREGKTFKSWISDITRINVEKHESYPRLVEDQVSFKGYTSKNLSLTASNSFLNGFNENIDAYAYYNCLVSLDFLLGAKPNALVEFYHKYKNEHEKTTRYLSKLNISVGRVGVIGEALEIVKDSLREVC